MKHSDLCDAKQRGISGLPRSVAFAALMFALLLPTDTAWGRGKPPPPPPPNPDIVYMSNSSRGPTSSAVRAVTLAGDGRSGADTQLVKAKTDRQYDSVAWSPDGTRFAWIEGAYGQIRSIMVGAPGQTPVAIYSAADGAGEDYVGSGPDALAWGPGCTPGTSVLVFRSFGGTNNRPPGIVALDISANYVPGQPRRISDINGASGFALSPTGQHLVFRYFSSNERVLILPMCPVNQPYITLVEKEAIGAADDPCDPSQPPSSTNTCNPDWAIQSIDWSRHGDRLALSVTIGPDPNYPWRDLKIAYLNYSYAEGAEQVLGHNGVSTINLNLVFGVASSEHSPQWGPSNLGDACQRIAFSQSAGASDGSTMNGRRLYLLDINAGDGGNCNISTPLQIDSKEPRAIDWK